MSACAAPDAPPSSPGLERPILIQLAQPSRDPADVVRQAQAIAGVPVRYRAASSPTWHAITLSCPTSQRCDQALQALRQSPTMVNVEVDRPVSVPPAVPANR